MSKIKIIISKNNSGNFHICLASKRGYGFYGSLMSEMEYWIKIYDSYEKI